jgi:hypothetical protein
MPSCSLEKHLTTYQANFTRMVTEIRNIIERKNGIFRMCNALEKCRNNQLSHKGFEIFIEIFCHQKTQLKPENKFFFFKV